MNKLPHLPAMGLILRFVAAVRSVAARRLIPMNRILLLAAMVGPVLAQPVITALRPDYSTTDAILHAEVSQLSEETVVWFGWGTTANHQYRSGNITLSPSPNPIRISHVITNLTPYASYFFQVLASNSVGVVADATYSPLFAVPRFVPTAAPKLNWNSIACSEDGQRVLASSYQSYWDNGPHTLPTSLIYLSTNFGVTWSSVAAPATNWGRVAMSADGTKLFASAGADIPGPIYASYDSGLTWRPIVEARPWRGLACSANGNTVLASSDFIFVSKDSGLTWTNSFLRSGAWRSATMSADGTKMAVADNTAHPRYSASLWVSTNAGGSWNGSGRRALALAASGNGAKLFSGGGTDSMGGISSDWGKSWTSLPMFDVLVHAATTYNGVTWFANSSFSGLRFSSDSGQSWVRPDLGFNAITALTCSSNGASAYVSDDQGTLYSWQESPPRLQIAFETDRTVLSWPSHRLSMLLQESSTLHPGTWADADQPFMSERIFRYTAPPSEDKAFFRLKLPQANQP